MTRQLFMTEMEAQLKAFDAKMARLAALPGPKGEQARLEREKTYYFLKARRDELREQLRQGLSTPDDGWDRFEASVKRVYADMSNAMDEIYNQAGT